MKNHFKILILTAIFFSLFCCSEDELSLNLKDNVKSSVKLKTSLPVVNESEPNNTEATADETDYNYFIYNGTLNDGQYQVDYLEFYLKSQSISIKFETSEIYMGLGLYNSQGAEVLNLSAKRDAVSTTNIYLTSGYYYLRVSGYYLGDYTVTVDDFNGYVYESEPNNSTSTSDLLGYFNEPVIYAGYLTSYDQDFLKINTGYLPPIGWIGAGDEFSITFNTTSTASAAGITSSSTSSSIITLTPGETVYFSGLPLNNYYVFANAYYEGEYNINIDPGYPGYINETEPNNTLNSANDLKIFEGDYKGSNYSTNDYALFKVKADYFNIAYDTENNNSRLTLYKRNSHSFVTSLYPGQSTRIRNLEAQTYYMHISYQYTLYGYDYTVTVDPEY
jgi:hypothetical protein